MREKHPVLLALVYVVLLSLFAAIATIIAQTLKISQVQTMLVQTFSFLLSSLLAMLVMRRTNHTLGDYGIRFVREIDLKEVLWFVPLALVESIPLALGIDKDISITYLGPLIALMIVVSINEELYFRGLILRTLGVKGTGFAIGMSSLLFGLVHLGSMTVGKGVGHTLVLAAYSALFGFVCAQIAIITRSLMVPIIWHFSHNFLASVTREGSPITTILIVGIQCTILLAYGIYLWQGVIGQSRYTKGESRRTYT